MTISNEEYAEYEAKLAERDKQYLEAGLALVNEFNDEIVKLQTKVADLQATMPTSNSMTMSNSRASTNSALGQLVGTIQQITFLKQNLDSVYAQYTPVPAPAPAS